MALLFVISCFCVFLPVCSPRFVLFLMLVLFVSFYSVLFFLSFIAGRSGLIAYLLRLKAIYLFVSLFAFLSGSHIVFLFFYSSLPVFLSCFYLWSRVFVSFVPPPPTPPVFSAWSGKPDMLRPGIVGMRGSMAIRLRPCMNIEYPPPTPPPIFFCRVFPDRCGQSALG